jgi:apolipoprotein N-acyltransferase
MTAGRIGPRLRAVAMGAVGACSYPVAIPGWGHGPLLDWFPREVLIFLYGAWMYRQLQPVGQRAAACRRLVWSGVGYYGLLIYWLDIAMERFGGLQAWQAVPAVCALVLLCAVLSASVGALYTALERTRCLPGPAAFAVAWVACEWGRGTWTQFPWGQWAYTQARNLPLAQWAALGGAWLVSFWVALFAAVLCSAWHGDRRARTFGLGGGVAVLGLGWAALCQPVSTGIPLRVGVVQASISQAVKNAAVRHRQGIIATYRALSAAAVQGGAELLIWPEGAWPGYLPTDVTRLPTPSLGVPLLAGVGLYAAPTGADAEDVHMYNSAFYLDTDLQVRGRYDKQQLVPFGEYVPLGKLLPVKRLVPSAADFVPGHDDTPLGPFGLGVLICYDGVYPGPSRRAVAAGAELLVNLTNDAWYGASSAPYQHRDFYVLRAIETGRWVVRAANNGISVAIDPKGRMGQGTQLDAATWAGYAVQRIPKANTTPFVRHGEVLLGVCLSATAGAVLWAGVSAIPQRRRHPV